MKNRIKSWLLKQLGGDAIGLLEAEQKRIKTEQEKIWVMLKEGFDLQKVTAQSLKQTMEHVDKMSDFQIQHATQNVKINKQITSLIMGIYQTAGNVRMVNNGSPYKN